MRGTLGLAMKRFLLTSSILSLCLAGCAANTSQPPTEEGVPADTNMEENMMEGETMLVEYLCEAPGHMHPQGVLTAQYEDGVLVGWTCTLSSHHICTAPADGQWTECTFEPPGWPEPVREEFLNNPPPEESEEMYGEEYGEEAY
jgi:hypothetical protein